MPPAVHDDDGIKDDKIVVTKVTVMEVATTPRFSFTMQALVVGKKPKLEEMARR